MPVSRDELDKLGTKARASLAADLATFPTASGLSRRETRELVGHRHRADTLHAWLRAFGSASPLAGRTRQKRPSEASSPDGKGRTHLIVGDCHASPGQDLRRFADLGRFVARLRPDVVVQIGDWYSFDSLCDHESTKLRSGERLREEVAAGEAALEAYHAHAPTVEHHWTLGNHDVRVAKLADGAPWLEGFYSVGAAHEARGWTVTGYRTPLRLDGIRYQHDLPSAGGNRAIGGKFHALRLLERVKFGESVVVGHSHRLDYRTESSHLGKRVHGVVVGCFLDHIEDYAGPDNAEWWSGVVILRNVHEGRVGRVEFVPRDEVG